MSVQMWAPILGVVVFAIAVLLYKLVKDQPVGDEKMH